MKLLMGGNGFKGIKAGKALGDAIAANTVLKELDISGGKYDSQKCDVDFFKGFSPGLGANGALTSLDISSNNLGPWDVSKQAYDMSGIKALAAAIPECK